MRGLSLTRTIMILTLLAAAAQAHAAQGITSTAKNVNAVMQARGVYLAPVSNVPVAYSSGDLAPVQSFEIVRPNMEKVTIGRLYTSCPCVQLESSKRTFERGERAVLHLRNVIATPPAGQHYAVYVQITSPVRATLRYDTFVQSSQFVTASPIAVLTDTDITEAAEEIKEDLNTAESGVQASGKAAGEQERAAAGRMAEALPDKYAAFAPEPEHDKYSVHTEDGPAEEAAEIAAGAMPAEEPAAAAAVSADPEREEAAPADNSALASLAESTEETAGAAAEAEDGSKPAGTSMQEAMAEAGIPDLVSTVDFAETEDPADISDPVGSFGDIE